MHSDFQQYFNLPFAGGRSFSNAALNVQGEGGYYWSSSPYGDDFPEQSRYLYLSYSNARAIYSQRALGSSVRCFKDSYVARMTYEVTFNPNN